MDVRVGFELEVNIGRKPHGNLTQTQGMRLTKAGIDLNALHHNYRIVRERVGSRVKIMGIVKANAYGHGMLSIARALISYGCEYLAVAFAEEGIALRNAGITAPILVLGGAMPEHAREYLEHDLRPTLTTLEAARQLDSETRRAGKTSINVHLKVDTGMERQGIRSEQAFPFIRDVCRLKGINVEGIYSHFATSEVSASPFAAEQFERYQLLLREIERAGIEIPLRHIANSGGIINMPESYCSLVRPGIMLYGYSPSSTDPMNNILQPVLSLTSAVMFVKQVPGRTSISYGRTYFTPSSTTIATVPLGYGDGYSRRLSNQSSVLIKGKRYPVVGTICMDQMMVDVGGGSDIRAGDAVTAIGRDGDETISAWNLAETIGTIPYEVLTGISERVPRIYFP